jgi:hypothetical protein
MTWIVHIIVALVLLLLAAGLDGTPATPGTGIAPGWEAITVDGHEAVILSEEDALRYAWDDVEDSWMPAVADIEEAETAIREQEGDLDHMRQYLGWIVDGERVIYVNGFCDDLGRNWHAEYIAVDDGGECFFSATYNVDTGELEYFSYNGFGEMNLRSVARA